jgi:hypothetical protein
MSALDSHDTSRNPGDHESIARWIDHQQIHEVVLKYCRGIDRRDAELVRSTYHRDARDQHSTFAGGRDEYVDWVMARLRAFEITQHTISNHLVHFDEDGADSEAYVVGYLVSDHGATKVLKTFGGRYIDRFDRRDGQWRIARRTLVFDWVKVEALTEPADIATYEPRGVAG